MTISPRLASNMVRRARVNGVDSPEIYYTEAIIALLNNDQQQAVEALESAYERGWRQAWVLKVDRRLQALRDQPAFIELEQRIDRARFQA